MYRIIIKKPAKKFIDKLPKNEKQRIVKAIEKLPEGEDIKKLKGHDNIYIVFALVITEFCIQWIMVSLL